MSLVNLDLPMAPSVNSLYATVNGRRVLSREGRIYHKTVAALVKAQCSRAVQAAFPWETPVALSLYVTFPDRRRCDVSNRIKALEDALKLAGVYKDDSQVTELHAYKKYERGVSRIYVMIDPLAKDAKAGEKTPLIGSPMISEEGE